MLILFLKCDESMEFKILGRKRIVFHGLNHNYMSQQKMESKCVRSQMIFLNTFNNY